MSSAPSLGRWNDVRTAGRFAQWEVRLEGGVQGRTSNPFTIGGWSWQLSVQRPDSAHIRVTLVPLQPYAGVDRMATVLFQSLHHHGGGGPPVAVSKTTKVLLDGGWNRGLIWTLRDFVSARFLIKFIAVELRNGDAIWPSNQIHTTALQADARSGLARMLNDGIFTDILVNADGGSIKAHRAVLAARSPVFMRMFSSDLREAQHGAVDISDMSLDACRAFIRCLYCGVPEAEFLAHRGELLAAGDKYNVPELKDVCERSLADEVDEDNVMARLQVAHLYGLATLKDTCMWLLVELLKMYDVPEGFREFMQTGHPDLVAEVMQVCREQGDRVRRLLQSYCSDYIHPILEKKMKV